MHAFHHLVHYRVAGNFLRELIFVVFQQISTKTSSHNHCLHKN